MDKLRWHAGGLLLAGVLAFGPGRAGGAVSAVLEETNPAATRLVEWEFDGDLQGWRPNGHLAEVRIEAGALRCRGAGSDPILEYGPLLELKASPWQALEVRLRADRSGTAEWFWSNTTEGRYGGFEQAKSTRFEVIGDGQWHDYRVLPFWHPEGRIVRLRLDLFDGAEFFLDHARVVEWSMPEPAARPEFDFAGNQQGWQGLEGAAVSANSEGLGISGAGTTGFALGPPLEMNAGEAGCLSVRMSVSRGHHGTVLFATEQGYGLQRVTFPIVADGRERAYHVDMLAAEAWRGRVVALGLRPSDDPAAESRVRWLRVSAQPEGPAQLVIRWFGLEEAVPRVGRPTLLSAIVANSGGQNATNLCMVLSLPGNVEQLEALPVEGGAGLLGQGEEMTMSWKVAGQKPLSSSDAVASLELTADHAESASASTGLRFTPPPDLRPAPYVPEPKPVRGPYEVGAYYFPGWKSASQWHPIRRFPERRPVLGWYREGEPEVADWQIKWAVEHGITFFVYDWYWSQGSRQLEHALHDGYFQARYRHLLKFCLLWANHNPPNTSSQADCLAVTRWWIEHYFRRTEYLQLEEKPVIVIFSPDRLRRDLGQAGVREALEQMRRECRQAGLGGLYLVACVGDTGQARQAAEDGYDAVTAYTWPGLGRVGSEWYAPFESLLEGYRQNWRHLVDQGELPLLLPFCGGWDSRPWHGENNLVRFGRTPELFERHLRDGVEFLRTADRKSATGKMVLIEAWNEWGEGSYIEPHTEFGFGYLDAIREVFVPGAVPHLDLAPADVGLGPYDVPPQPPRTEWDFARDNQGWDNVMGMSDLEVREGIWRGQTTSRDPALFSPPTETPASRHRAVELRLMLRDLSGGQGRETAQLFWRTAEVAESEAASERFPVEVDGEWHEYRVVVAGNPRWRGVITRLRLDPGSQPGVAVAVDWIRLKP